MLAVGLVDVSLTVREHVQPPKSSVAVSAMTLREGTEREDHGQTNGGFAKFVATNPRKDMIDMMSEERPTRSRGEARRSVSGFASFVALATAGVLVLCSSDAHADEPATDYCKKVTETAKADASLLFAPTVAVQVIRFPEGGIADKNGLQQGSGIQPRASASIGFVDIYKGLGVLDVAHADCQRQALATPLQEVITQRSDIGRLPALEKKIELLKARKSEVEALVKSAEDRFAAHITTLLEVHELRKRALELELKTSDAEREAEVLRRRGIHGPSQPIMQALSTYEDRAVAYEKSVAHVRKLQPWAFNLTAGVTAQPTVDYFGVVEVSYNFGGLFKNGYENRAVEARTQEMKQARYEMHQQVSTLVEELRIQARHTSEQVAAFDKEIERITSERKSLEGADTPNKAQVVAALTMELVDLESERAYLSTLAKEQTNFGGEK